MGMPAGTSANHSEMLKPRFLEFPPVPPLVGPLGTAYQIEARSKGSVVISRRCAVRIRFRRLVGLPISDQAPGTGDEVICLTHMWMDLDGPEFGTLVTRGEIRRRGLVRIRALLDRETDVCHRKSRHTWYEMRGTRCYEPDPSYAPEITVPFESDPTQGFVLGGYAPRPASPLIATEGLFFRYAARTPPGYEPASLSTPYPDDAYPLQFGVATSKPTDLPRTPRGTRGST